MDRSKLLPRRAPEIALPLGARRRGVALSRWLYDELRAAILDGRLRRGARLPATRDLAQRYGISRGVAVRVFEQLADEGYVGSRVSAGTTVRSQVADDFLIRSTQASSAPRTRRQLASPTVARPFC